MIDYREVLRLDSLGNSQRSIANQVQSSRNTVASIITAAEAAGVSWPLGDDITNQDLQDILFPGKYAYASPYTLPDCPRIHAELALLPFCGKNTVQRFATPAVFLTCIPSSARNIAGGPV